MIRPEDLEIIIFGAPEETPVPVAEDIEFEQSAIILPTVLIAGTGDTSAAAVATISDMDPEKYTGEWKALDAKAARLYNDRAAISNALINLANQEQRAIAYQQIVSMTHQYNDLQKQKKMLERGETIPVIKEAKEKDYSGYTDLELHKAMENLRSKRSKRKKSLDNPETLKPRLVQKYQAEIKSYDVEIERLTKQKNAHA